MTTTVEYQSTFKYILDPALNQFFPGLALKILVSNRPDTTLDVVGYFDTGAEYSLFDGEPFVASFQVDLLAGAERIYRGTFGAECAARVHEMFIFHPDLGTFPLRPGLSTA